MKPCAVHTTSAIYHEYVSFSGLLVDKRNKINLDYFAIN